jgi:hypothetical protein
MVKWFVTRKLIPFNEERIISSKKENWIYKRLKSYVKFQNGSKTYMWDLIRVLEEKMGQNFYTWQLFNCQQHYIWQLFPQYGAKAHRQTGIHGNEKYFVHQKKLSAE